MRMMVCVIKLSFLFAFVLLVITKLLVQVSLSILLYELSCGISTWSM